MSRKDTPLNPTDQPSQAEARQAQAAEMPRVSPNETGMRSLRDLSAEELEKRGYETARQEPFGTYSRKELGGLSTEQVQAWERGIGRGQVEGRQLQARRQINQASGQTEA